MKCSSLLQSSAGPDRALRSQIKQASQRGLLSNQNTATAHPASLPLPISSLSQPRTCWPSELVHLRNPWSCSGPQGASCYLCSLHRWPWSGLLYISWLLQLCYLESPKRKQNEWNFQGAAFHSNIWKTAGAFRTSLLVHGSKEVKTNESKFLAERYLDLELLDTLRVRGRILFWHPQREA